jgi:hypothetical protein
MPSTTLAADGFIARRVVKMVLPSFPCAGDAAARCKAVVILSLVASDVSSSTAAALPATTSSV